MWGWWTRWKGALPGLSVVVLCVAMGLLLYVRVWDDRPSHATTFPGDVLSYYLPENAYLGASIRNDGIVPLWNPHEFLGMPFLATMQSGPLYPIHGLAAVLPPDALHYFRALFHALIAGAGFFFFARKALGLGVAAAFCVPVVFVCSGVYLTDLINAPDASGSMAYFGWALYAADRLWRKPDIPGSLSLAGVLVWTLLAGEIEVCVRTGQVLLAYVAMLAIRDSGGSGVIQRFAPRMCAYAGAGLLAIALGAVQWLPAFEAAGQSVRPTDGLSYFQATAWGAVDPESIAVGLLQGLSPNASAFYVGILALTLAGYALATSWYPGASRKATRVALWLFAFLAIVALDLSTGAASWLYPIYFHLPTGDWFRFPVRFLPYAIAGIAVCAGLGLQYALDDLRSGIRSRRYAMAALVAVLLAALFWPGELQRHPVSIATVFVFVAGGVGLVVDRVAIRGAGGFQAAAALLVVGMAAVPLLFFDFRSIGVPKHVQMAPLPEPIEAALSEAMDADGTRSRVYVDFATRDYRRMPKIGPVRSIDAINGFSPFMPAPFWEVVEAARAERVRGESDAEESAYTPVGLWAGLSWDDGADALLPLFGVRHVLVGLGSELFGRPGWPLPEAIPDGVQLLAVSRDLALLRLDHAWPRAFLLPDADYPSIDAVLAARPLVEALPYRDSKSAGHSTISVPVPEATDGGGLVVVSNQAYPGWRARLASSGDPLPTIKVGGLFLGTTIPASATGDVVLFEYRPWSYAIGTLLSLCGGGVALSLVVYSLIAARRSPTRGTVIAR